MKPRVYSMRWPNGWSYYAVCSKCRISDLTDLPAGHQRTWVDAFIAADNHARTYGHQVSRKNWGKT